MIDYQEFLPCPDLREYIKCYWILDSNDQIVNTEDIILPCGCIDIVLQRETNLGAKLLPTVNSIILPRFIIGPQSIAGFVLNITGRVKIFGVRLLPHTAKCVFGFPLRELKNSIWPLQQVFSADYSSLAEQVVNAYSNIEAAEIANRFFLEKKQLFLPIDFMVKNVCNAIVIAKGDVKLQDLFCKYRETEQTLRTRFWKEVGIGPKEFISIARFQYAMSLLDQNLVQQKTLTDIALSAGYYDQAHFIKSFNEIAGLTPGQYTRQTHSVSNFFIQRNKLSSLLNIQ